MNFGESVLFAAIMTLMDEMKSEKKKETSTDTVAPYYTNDIPSEILYDTLSVKNQLCALAQDLFDKADEACQTATDISAKEVVLSFINGVIFEVVDAINVRDENKKKVYEFALQYCTIDSDFRWELLNTDDRQIADVLLSLADVGMAMVITASIKAETHDAMTGFIKLLAEFMLHLEDAIMKNFGSLSLSKRPPIIVLEKALSSLKKEMEQMEAEDPSLKEHPAQSEESKNLERLFDNARSELDSENMGSAAAYYREILKIDPNNWEAMFYSVFCSAHRTSYTANAYDIPNLTSAIVQCVPNAMRQARNKLFSQMDILIEIGGVATHVCKLASNYFVASMNTFKASFGGAAANTSKVLQVSSIINMLFVVGDSIAENFGDDDVIAENVACACWKTGFTCYENCNMPVPPKMYDHYLKILKYEPSFKCSKPLTDNTSGGCYIATAVYGSYDCPQVWTLRRYRDYSLAKNWFGRAFIRFYYATSPTLVKWFGRMNWFNVGCRKILDKLVNKLMADGYENTPYVDGKEN